LPCLPILLFPVPCPSPVCYLEVVDIFIIITCVISFLWWSELALEWWLAARSGLDLADVPELPNRGRLSVIVPARNEEKNIEQALTSLLEALPGGGEVIVVNDRSTDETGPIAHRLARSDTRLRVLDVTELPHGWLGKTHAMQQGYHVSTGDFILFTDGDVIFQPGCLARAVGLCEKERIDHLVATPLMITRGFWERAFVSFFSIMLVSRFRLWRASHADSRFFAGIGAFNLVTRAAYEKAGTHQAIKAEVVDDLLLGRLVKRSGGKQRVVSGERSIQVRWNEGLRGLINGLEKNAFAGFDYSPLLTVAGCLGMLLITVVPGLSPLLFLVRNGPGVLTWAAWAGTGVWLSFFLLYRLSLRGQRASWAYVLTFPTAVFLLAWAILRSMALYYRRGGVKWRGTVYKKSGEV